EWESASQAREVVPTARLSPPGSAAPAPSPSPSPNPGPNPNPNPGPSPTPTPQPSGGTGLQAEYFRGLGSPSLVLRRIDHVVLFDWGGNAPDPVVGADEFVARWTGQVEPRFTDAYSFHAT